MIRQSILGVSAYREDGDAVVLTCPAESAPSRFEQDRDVEVTIRFLDPETFRFELAVAPTGPSDAEFPEYDEAALTETVSPTVTEADGELAIATDALELTIGLDRWHFEVRSTDGTVLFAEQDGDVDVAGEPRVPPLGFTEERFSPGPPLRVTETGTSFSLAPDERIYGLGEKFTALDKRGQRIESWQVDPLGTETEGAYKNVPFHLSTRGYGLLVDTTSRVTYDFGAESTASATLSVADDTFAFYFFKGPDFEDILASYTALTGRPSRPPKWSFGLWMSRLGYESREQLESITARLRGERIPCDVVHLDPFWMRDGHACDLVWDTEQFPDPEGMIEGLHEDGFRVSLWEHPHVPVGTDAFEEAVDNGYLVADGTGTPYVMDRTCQGSYQGGLVDFTDPDAVEWWRAKHRDLLEMGVDTFKTDYGEYVPEDAVFESGQSGAAMHNLYPHLYNRAVYGAVAAANGEDDALVWARSAWTGGQRYPVHWGGDPQVSFNGMANALRGGLSASLSGFGFWSHDIGGFSGRPSEELYVRWAQFGLLSSHARCHGTTPREPWAFGERATEIFRRYAELRYRLLPYIYSHAEQTARTGIPVVRPLVLGYQDDRQARSVESEFLLGEDILVAPVFESATSREVYLPAGEWVDYWTDERYAGEQWVAVDAPLERLPLFVRAPSLLPTREPTQSVRDGTPERLSFEATLPADGAATASFPFYDEDADSVVEFELARSADGDLSVTVPDSNVESLTVTAAADPSRVTVDGEPLRRVDSDPKPGEWTRDETGSVRVRWRDAGG